MDDENRRQFRERLRRLALGQDDEEVTASVPAAHGRLPRGQGAGWGLRITGAVLTLAFAFLFVKAVIIAHEGPAAYAARIAEERARGGYARLVAVIMQADPVSLAMARLWQEIRGGGGD